MTNPVRDYAWGSTDQLARFLDRPPSGRPEAELWIGAHDGDPSGLPDGRRLNAVIAEDPVPVLGARVCDVFGDRLPFLMKVLAVDQPLSLQVHPSSERARLGHRHEDAEGVPLDAGHRNYKDTWHKPELIFALTRFEGLAGFRDVSKSAAMLRLLKVPWADDVAERLEQGPPHEALRAVVTETLALEGRRLARILRDVGDAARHAGARAARDEGRHPTHRTGDPALRAEAARTFTRCGQLVRDYPRDPGVLVTLLLNNVLLAPGEAMFVNAGVVHAYLEGLGVEIMASSDNVLRAGLTPKHMDVEELLTITSFTPIPPPRWDPSERASGYCHLEPPVGEFCLTVGQTPLRRLPSTGPRTVLVLEGTVTVAARGASSGTVTASRGQSVFVTHDDGQITLTGDARVAIGSVPV
ncbi:mannose-6-phosphate isomerase, class I [Nocardioides sp.]|uniref:mannose-6-phosphate isomerase, class I n=1 Tax=Nocardioides sp. TaxID=35761 RepID=UPI0027291526|nr:mannose-6-phosphate isomerase, class I [Nocardioides sp.]MDO9454938.1 mannose-6-phosphate isomerase, class I [Nocardioides sp.]